MSIIERDDVRWVLVTPAFEGDSGVGYRLGFEDVTTIKIVARHGPMDWIPYVEVWQGDHLYAEAAQHQCSVVEFKPALKTTGKDSGGASLATPSHEIALADQWQPIETAPKDRGILVGCWVDDEWSQWFAQHEGTTWPWGNDGTYGDEPTHWHEPVAAPATILER